MILKNASVKYLIDASGASLTDLDAKGFQLEKGIVPSRPFAGLAENAGVCTNEDFRRVRIVILKGVHTDLERVANGTKVSFELKNGVFTYKFDGIVVAGKPITYKSFDEATNVETDVECFYLDFKIEEEVEVTASI